MNILIAEDNTTNQTLLKYFLIKENYNFIFANDGREALLLFQKNKFDLVLMDMEMPVMDGIEATRRIRIIDDRIPIIAISAYIEDAIIKSSFDAGVNEYLTKPYNRQDILSLISKHINFDAITN
ncbi:MAG: response regulator [Bacteroidales bacterium]|nr:response regulator [Bacteroidales bacterium]